MCTEAAQKQLGDARRVLVFTATGQVGLSHPGPPLRPPRPPPSPLPPPPQRGWGLTHEGLSQVLYATHPVATGELPELAAVSEDSDRALQVGITLEGRRYEVHRHYDSLVYGRTLEQDPTQSEGIAVCRSTAAEGLLTVFAVVTYRMPHVSARMVSSLEKFCAACLEPLVQ